MFPNNVDAEFLRIMYRNAGLKNKIADYAKKKGYVFDANRKILLSPLKIIRRKNVIETLW